MNSSLSELKDLVSAGRFGRAVVEPSSGPWRLQGIAGRLVEISGAGATASLTLAFGLTLEAQWEGEPVAWVTAGHNIFYPPDPAEGGVDLDALAVIRVPDARAVARAADLLVRSGGFGLIVLDLPKAEIPTPLQARLAGLAQKHHTALICLTEKPGKAPSLGSLISLRVHAQRKPIAEGRFACELTVLKDKRRGPTWAHREVCRGPAGL